MKGTLCRLIPLDKIEGRVQKYRVEVGDVGQSIGTVMLLVGGARVPDQYQVFYMPNGVHGEVIEKRVLFEHPAEAALYLAGLYVKKVRQEVEDAVGFE